MKTCVECQTELLSPEAKILLKGLYKRERPQKVGGRKWAPWT
jgi:hypothetical protein